MVREHVLNSLGLWPLPERLPLDTHVSGVVEHEDYTLKRVYWQTWPNYYASGYLFTPKHAKLPAPGILCPHGHWENGARNPVVQDRCISMAMKGYVVLAVDSVHVYNWAVGLQPLTAMIWNDMRGIDLLCSLPEVDPKRLGCTGCSGGGQQTFYLMATDERLAVAIPVCMVSEWRTILSIDSHHCACNHLPGILTKTDTPELAAAFAPKPALMICVTQDWTATYPKNDFPATKRVFELFGAGDKVKCKQYDWHHDYSLPMREEAYGFFNHYLMVIDDPAQGKEPVHVDETLEALAKLDGPPANALPASSIAADIMKRRGYDESAPTGNIPARLAAIRDKFIALTNEAGVQDADAVHTVGEPAEVEGCKAERVVVTSEREIPVPAVVLTAPQGEAKRRPAVILLNPAGKADLLSARWALVKALAEKGLVVCAPDVRPYGELGMNREAQDMNGVVFGRPELAMAGHDTKRIAAYLRTRADVDPAQIRCVGFGEAAVVALAAGICDPSLERIAALGIGDTYGTDRLPRASQILTVGDLPQLAGCLAPKPLWVQGATRPKTFGWAEQAYAGVGAQGSFLMTQPEPDEADLVAWLSAR
jgi:dienelactone hydrolase